MSLQGQNKTIEHRVQKGENVYRLSLRYNVTINDIYELNPQAKELIRIGEILLIPVKPQSKSPDGSNTDNNYYKVNKGETKFGLSKKFGISIAELEEANPFIKSGLQAGHRLKVPSNNNPANSTDASKISHKVLKGETLWGISRRYNLSLEELKTLNRNVLGSVLLEGQVLSVIDSKISLQIMPILLKEAIPKLVWLKNLIPQ